MFKADSSTAAASQAAAQAAANAAAEAAAKAAAAAAAKAAAAEAAKAAGADLAKASQHGVGDGLKELAKDVGKIGGGIGTSKLSLEKAAKSVGKGLEDAAKGVGKDLEKAAEHLHFPKDLEKAAKHMADEASKIFQHDKKIIDDPGFEVTPKHDKNEWKDPGFVPQQHEHHGGPQITAF
jgi:hypothetical protein